MAQGSAHTVPGFCPLLFLCVFYYFFMWKKIQHFVSFKLGYLLSDKSLKSSWSYRHIISGSILHLRVTWVTWLVGAVPRKNTQGSIGGGLHELAFQTSRFPVGKPDWDGIFKFEMAYPRVVYFHSEILQILPRFFLFTVQFSSKWVKALLLPRQGVERV